MENDVLIDGRKIAQDLERYRKIMMCLQGDSPIQVLCLPKQLENKLILSGCLRIYDMIDLDFSKIKGIGKIRGAFLRSCLNEFLSISE